MTKRKPITVKMVTDWFLLASEGAAVFRCAICFQPLLLGQQIQWDHSHALVFDGPHNFRNLRPVHYDPCHKAKTKRDVQALAKVKRLSGETCKRRKGRLLSGKGFDRRYRKKMDGTVVKRED